LISDSCNKAKKISIGWKVWYQIIFTIQPQHILICQYRWMTETAFSSIKRIFGEHITARKCSNMVKEIFLPEKYAPRGFSNTI
ncbi:MAG: hypothetical protein WBE61_04985, partial [Nitrososphaeraceae archaeon]